MPDPATLLVVNRDLDALEAIRNVLLSIDTLWPIDYANRLQSDAAVPTSATDSFIVEQAIGGPSTIAEIGGTNPLRQRSRQVQYLIHAAVDTGLDAMQQAALIEHALYAAPITMADDEADGPITVMIDSVLTRPTRPVTAMLPHQTTPVIVAYRFYSV